MNQPQLPNCPIKPETFESIFVEPIINAIKSGLSVTFTFTPYLGGQRAWPKYLYSHQKDLNFHHRIPTCSFYCFDPSDCLDSSNQGFFYHLAETLQCPHLPPYTKVSLQEIIVLIRNRIDSLVSRGQHLTLFLVKLDSLSNLNVDLGNLLFSLYKPNYRQIHLVTTISSNNIKDLEPEIIGSLSEPLRENIISLAYLSNTDMLHVIKHWEKILDHSFSDKETKLILKYSAGSTHKCKVLCQRLSQNKITGQEKLCQNTIKISFSPPLSLKLSKKDEEIILGQRSITANFPPQEQETLKALIDNQNKIVTRDMLGNYLWGNQAYEKYSDQAVDKFISLVRQKLTILGFAGQIKTVKKCGYQLLQATQ